MDLLYSVEYNNRQSVGDLELINVIWCSGKGKYYKLKLEEGDNGARSYLYSISNTFRKMRMCLVRKRGGTKKDNTVHIREIGRNQRGDTR
jgi:hypothetical protein